MGITGFYQFLQENVPEAFAKININIEQDIYFDHIYFDLNYLLHQCSYNSDSTTMTLKKVETMIKDVCQKFNPLQSINLCADGSAPLAKILLQRERRSNDSPDNFVLNFTPGSEFMNTLHEKLNTLKSKLELIYSIKVNIFNLDVGESEIKIKSLILKNINKNNFSTHLAVTNDADVVLIMSATKFYESIYILTKNKEQNLVSIKTLIDKSGINPLDFCFLNLFLGNDYLPKLKIVTPEKLWIAYKIHKSYYKSLVEICTESYQEYLKVNDDFLKRILIDVIGQTKISIINKSTLKSYDSDMIKSYLEGLMWCLNMYFFGDCINNHYMYEGLSIDPIHIIIFLNSMSINQTKNLRKTNSISNDLCSIILLPYSAKKLVNPKYYDFMDSNPILYQSEHCKTCKKYKINGETTKINEEKNHQYIEHKKSHNNLLKSDIIDIQERFNQLCL
jgi:5'-3' exonuclease